MGNFGGDIDQNEFLIGATDNTPIGNVGDALKVSATQIPAEVDTGNSTSTPLGNGATFTGSWTNVLAHTNVSIMVTTDKDSATNGLVFQQSSDGVNVDDTDSYTISANVPKQYTFGVAAKFVRVVYTNGSQTQGFFRLQTIHHPFAPKPSSHRLDDTPISQDDAELVKAVLTGKSSAGNNYVNVKVNPSGSLITTPGAPVAPANGSGSLGSLNADVIFDNSDGYSAISFVITGTWSGTITPGVSVNNSDYIAWECMDRATVYTSMTANGTFTANIANHRYFRLRMTAYTSGTASVSYFATANPSVNQRVLVNTQTSSTAGATQRVQVVQIPTEHDKIHLGLLFNWTHKVNLNSGNSRRISMTTGVQTEHTAFSVLADYQCTVTLYEGSTTTDGAAITEYNRSRSSANTSLCTVAQVTTFTTAGTTIFSFIFGSTSGSAASVSFPRDQEWILKASTKYVFEVTSGQNNNDITLLVDHYRNQA